MKPEIKAFLRASLLGVVAMIGVALLDISFSNSRSAFPHPHLIDSGGSGAILAGAIVLAGYLAAIFANRRDFGKAPGWKNPVLTLLWYFVGLLVVGVLAPAR